MANTSDLAVRVSTNVNVYVISLYSGIDISHHLFNGRAIWVSELVLMIYGAQNRQCVIMCLYAAVSLPLLVVSLYDPQGDDFIEYPSPRTDLNGHGTHVAGEYYFNNTDYV